MDAQTSQQLPEGEHATPIAQLEPGISEPQNRVVEGEITLTWPFSIVTKAIAFKLVECDFRLRRDRGQVRVEFYGAAGKAVADAGIGGGDRIRLSLAGVEWERVSGSVPARPDTLEWQLKFRNRVRLSLRRTESETEELIHVEAAEATEEPITNGIAEGDPPTPRNIDDLYDVTPPRHSPVRQVLTVPAKRSASTALDGDEFTSPAFLKRARVSYGSLFEGGFDMFDHDKQDQPRKKRSRFSMHTSWRYQSRTPEPEPEQQSDVEVEETEETHNDYAEIETPSRAPMVDEGSQTHVVAVPGPSIPVATAFAEDDSVTIPNTPTPFHVQPSQFFDGDVAGTRRNLFGQEAHVDELPPNSVEPVSFEPGTLTAPIDDFFMDPINSHTMIQPPPSQVDISSRPIDVAQGSDIVGEFTRAGVDDHPLTTGNDLFSPAPVYDGGMGPNPELHNDVYQHFSGSFHQASTSFERTPVDPTDWQTSASSYLPAPAAADNSAAYPVEILDSSSQVAPSSPTRDEHQWEQPVSLHDVAVTEMDHVNVKETSTGYLDRDEVLIGSVNDSDGGDQPGDDYDLRIYDRAQDDDDTEPEEEPDVHPSDPDEQVVDLQEESDEDEESEIEEDWDGEESHNAARRNETHPFSQRVTQFEEDDDRYEGSENGEYSEDDYSEEEDANPEPQAPQEPVFISLLSDSEDDEEEAQTSAPKMGSNEQYLPEDSSTNEGVQIARQSSMVKRENLQDPTQSSIAQFESQEQIPSPSPYDEDIDSDAPSDLEEQLPEQEETVDSPEQAGSEEDDINMVGSTEQIGSIAREEDATTFQKEAQEVHIAESEPESMNVDEQVAIASQVSWSSEKETDGVIESSAVHQAPNQYISPSVEGPDAIGPPSPQKAEADASDSVHVEKSCDASEIMVSNYSAGEGDRIDGNVQEAAARSSKHSSPADRLENAVKEDSELSEMAQEDDPTPKPEDFNHTGPSKPETPSSPTHHAPNDNLGLQTGSVPSADDDYLPETSQHSELIEEELEDTTLAPPSEVPDTQDALSPAVPQALEEEVEDLSSAETKDQTSDVKPPGHLPTPSETQMHREQADSNDMGLDSSPDEDYSVAATQQIMMESQEYSQMFEDEVTSPVPGQDIQATTMAKSKSRPARDILITVASLRSWDHRKSISSVATDDAFGQDPSIALARARAPEAQATTQRKADSMSPAIRVTRSMAEVNDPSLALARASNTTTPLATQPNTPRETSPENKLKSPRAQRTPKRLQHTREKKTPEPHLSKADMSVILSPSVAESSAVEDENITTLKLQLARDLRTDLPDFISLKTLRNKLKRTTDVIAVVCKTPPQPHRPKAGPRDYMLEVVLTDQSSAPASVSVAHIFRPHQASLPTVEAGDVILLRRFTIVSMKGRGYGLRAKDESSWAVFEKGDEEMLPQIKGPPMEVTKEETKFAEGLRRWWALLDAQARRKIERVSTKAAQAGVGE